MATMKYCNSKIAKSSGPSLFMDAFSADVYFVCTSSDERTERVPAHKWILSKSNDVFSAMFNNSWTEQDEVARPGTSAAAFKQFLQFFYLDEVQLTAEHIGEVIDLAEQYMMDECLRICCHFLAYNLDERNLFTFYDLATVYSLDELKRLIEMYISLNTESILQSDEFLRCNREILSRIIKLNVLSCSEMVLLNACMDWVEEKTGGTLTLEAVQNHLGELMHEIRFGSINQEEFAAILDTYPIYSLFSAEEMNEIIQVIFSKDYRSKIFNENQRQTKINTSNEIEWARGICTTNVRHLYEIRETEIVTFSAKTNLIMTQIVCFPIYELLKRKYLVPILNPVDTELTIFELPCSADTENSDQHNDGMIVENSRVLFSDYIKFTERAQTRISLPKPIIIRSGAKYQIRFDQTIDDHSPFCTREMYTSTDDIILTIHGDQEGMSGGLIKCLMFNRI